MGGVNISSVVINIFYIYLNFINGYMSSPYSQNWLCAFLLMTHLAQKQLKGALDNISKFSFRLNFIDHVKSDC